MSRFYLFVFACVSPVVPTPFVEETSFPHLIVLAPLLKPTYCKCKGIFLDSQFYSLTCMCILMPIACCPDYHNFVSFEAGKCGSSNFVPVFQDCFRYSRSFAIPYEF